MCIYFVLPTMVKSSFAESLRTDSDYNCLFYLTFADIVPFLFATSISSVKNIHRILFTWFVRLGWLPFPSNSIDMTHGVAIQELDVLCLTAVAHSGRGFSLLNMVWQYFPIKNTFWVVLLCIVLGGVCKWWGVLVKVMSKILFIILFISFTCSSAEYYLSCWSEPGI